MSTIRRKDNKGRVLMENEFQKKDGRYEYRYRDLNGVFHSIYSWRLNASDRVPKEAKVSDDIIFIPLEKSPEYWAEEILRLDVSTKNDNHQQITQCGYDINEVTQRVQQFYIEKYNSCGDK